jgi:hypothetical protein
MILQINEITVPEAEPIIDLCYLLMSRRDMEEMNTENKTKINEELSRTADRYSGEWDLAS